MLVFFHMAVRNVSVLILYNDLKEILLQHRAMDAKRLPNYWAFFGGGLEPGETAEQTLKREIQEELEYIVRDPKLIYAQKFTHEEDKNTKYVFVEKFDKSQNLIQHEGQEMGWFRFDKLDDLLIVDHDRIALEKVEKFIKNI